MNDYLRFWQVEESIFLRELPEGAFFQTAHIRSVIPRLRHFAREYYPSVILLSGETGIGKTSFLRWLYYDLSAETHDIWYVPLLSLETQQGWLIRRLARFLGVADEGPIRLEALLAKAARKLDQLVEERRRLLVLIDDAHLVIKEEALADLSAFLNLQSMGARCLSFVIASEGNLEEHLGQNRGILSRTVMGWKFQPFTLTETLGYVQFRFGIAGRENVFTKEASQEIHRLARGIPGLINILAENSLFEGYQKKQYSIDAAMVLEASRYFMAFGNNSSPDSDLGSDPVTNRVSEPAKQTHFSHPTSQGANDSHVPPSGSSTAPPGTKSADPVASPRPPVPSWVSHLGELAKLSPGASEGGAPPSRLAQTTPANVHKPPPGPHPKNPEEKKQDSADEPVPLSSLFMSDEKPGKT